MYKKWLLIILLFLFSLFVTGFKEKDVKVVVIDAGHGGADPGAVYDDVYEKNINLNIALYLRDILQKNGIKVIMTRNDDYDLASKNATFRKQSDFNKRISIINDDSVDYYVSIHLNSFQSSEYFGPQVFYNSEKDDAVFMQNIMNFYTGGSRKIKRIDRALYLYKNLNKRGLLIECGFLSNDVERAKLKDSFYQRRLAGAIAEGILLIV